jgi:hypothetical protein
VSRKKHSPKEIISRLRQVDILVAQGQSDAIAATNHQYEPAITPGWAAGRGKRLLPARGSDPDRALAPPLQSGAAAPVLRLPAPDVLIGLTATQGRSTWPSILGVAPNPPLN